MSRKLNDVELNLEAMTKSRDESTDQYLECRTELTAMTAKYGAASAERDNTIARHRQLELARSDEARKSNDAEQDLEAEKNSHEPTKQACAGPDSISNDEFQNTTRRQ